MVCARSIRMPWRELRRGLVYLDVKNDKLWCKASKVYADEKHANNIQWYGSSSAACAATRQQVALAWRCIAGHKEPWQ